MLPRNRFMSNWNPLTPALLTGLLLVTPAWGQSASIRTFGVVPQQSPTNLARTWGPMLRRVSVLSGVELRFRTAPDITAFAQRLAEGRYDFAYMNPYHYTVFSQRPGYRALVHGSDRPITGLIVVRNKDPAADLENLAGPILAFPAPTAFAASMLTRAEFRRRSIPIEVRYVGSHDSVYHNVAQGPVAAGGGVQRTLDALDVELRDQLRMLWTTRAYTPHAVAAHPRVPAEVIAAVRQAMVDLRDSQGGAELLAALRLSGWQSAEDVEWNDVRSLELPLLDLPTPVASE